MPDDQIRFNDGVAYEKYMGRWSQLIGDTFLKWIAPQRGLRWLDVGCGNGAFTEMITGRYAPTSVHGIDPSPEQIAFARARPGTPGAQYDLGDAMALPYADHQFDVAVMPLVIFFVSEPARGVAEMARVVCPGGMVTAYAWDMVTGGFPYSTLQTEMRAMGVATLAPPSVDAARQDNMRALWAAAGLREIETREISVQRTYRDFDDYWETILGGPSVAPRLAAMSPDALAQLKSRMRTILPADDAGRITYAARANAVKGRVPQ